MSSPTRPRAAIRLLRAPLDSGHVDVRMGAGPSALAEAGAADRLRGQGHDVSELVLVPSPSWRAELATGFEVNRLVARAVAEARAGGEVPVLLAGNCNATLGVLAGMTGSGRRLGLVWLDAHGDFNTPDADPFGFLDGQGLAIAVGRCWRAAAQTIPGFRPLAEQDVVLVGARDLTEAQRDVLRSSEVAWLPPGVARGPDAIAAAIERLAERVEAIHFHVDLDVHDPSIAPANEYAAADGLSAAEVQEVLRVAAGRLPIVSAALASYDPDYDPDGRMRDVALDLLEAVAGVVST